MGVFGGWHSNFYLLGRAREARCSVCVTVSHNCKISVVLLVKCSLVAFYIYVKIKYITKNY